jgi:hypothetical protein
MGSALLEDDLGVVLPTIVDPTGERTIVVNPNPAALRTLVEALTEEPDETATTVLAGGDVVKDVMDDFLVASKAADLVEADRLALKVLESPPNHSIVIGRSEVTALVDVGGPTGALSAEDDDFVASAREYYREVAAETPRYSLRTPPLSRIRDSLGADIGPGVAADFDAVLASLETVRGNGESLEEVTITLLVAARNNELLYDISKWGEDVGLASKATFSRTKTTMEEEGVIDTEKVPIDVGRPRLRLMLGDDRLADAEADELATVAQRLLAA